MNTVQDSYPQLSPVEKFRTLGTNALLLLPFLLLGVGLLTIWYQLELEGGWATAAFWIAFALISFALMLAWAVGVDAWNLRALRGASGRKDDLRDGQPAVLSGRVRSEGTGSLYAPFSEVPCAAFSYRISEAVMVSTSSSDTSRSSGSVTLVRAEGYHLQPTLIEGDHGRARLLGFPGLEDFREHVEGNEAKSWRKSLDRWLARFPEASTEDSSLGRRAREMDIHAQPARELAEDYYMSPIGTGVMMAIDESVLPLGAEVSAVGTWEEGEGGLSGRCFRPGANLVVFRGTPEQVVARLEKENGGYIKLVIGLLVVGVALVALTVLGVIG